MIRPPGLPWVFRNWFKDLEGKSVHQRTYFYLRDKFWILLDKVSTDRPRKVEALWHWHPDNEVTLPLAFSPKSPIFTSYMLYVHHDYYCFHTR